MKPLFFTIALLVVSIHFAIAQDDQLSFKEQQLEYRNVKSAYVDQGKVLEDMLAQKKVYTLGNYLYIRVFKREKEVEIWFRPLASGKYRLLETLSLCSNSGDVGPKQRMGDQRIPEGFYEINRFAPEDPYLMALGINYPNQADQYRNSPAANIEFRGGCKSSGSMPLNDSGIKKLYVLAVEAYAVGQTPIPVHIFPVRMEGEAFRSLTSSYTDRPETVRFWHNIKTGYDYFQLTKRLPKVETGKAGTYLFKDGGVEVVGTTAPITVGSLNQGRGGASSKQPGNNPPPTASGGNNPPSPQNPPANNKAYHTVEEGETLYGISKQYRRSLYLLKKWNDIQGNMISPGQQIRIVPPDYYVVKKGDTLYGIARRYGLRIEELKAMNNLPDNTVKVGDKLEVLK